MLKRSTHPPLSVAVVGVGAIGGYLGVALSSGGAEVVLVGRPAAPPRPTPTATDLAGRDLHAGALRVSADDAALGRVDVCIVAVKASDTDAVAKRLASCLSKDTLVITLQNGLDSLPRLRAQLGDHVIGGVVTFNVCVDQDGRRRQASTGKLIVGSPSGSFSSSLRALRSAFHRGGIRIAVRSDIEQVMAGKLLVNLGNGVCTATGLSFEESLRDRDARWCYAACILEGARVLRAAGMRPARVAMLPPRGLALALRLPNWFIEPMIRRLGRIGRDARPSTLQDLDRGRRTEIGELNGAIVRIAASIGMRAPLNDVVTHIVSNHEKTALAGGRPTFCSAHDLRERLLMQTPRGELVRG